MARKQVDIWNVIGILLSLVLVIISPSVPKLSIAIILIILSSLVVILILVIVYLNMIRKVSKIEKENEEILKELQLKKSLKQQ